MIVIVFDVLICVNIVMVMFEYIDVIDVVVKGFGWSVCFVVVVIKLIFN